MYMNSGLNRRLMVKHQPSMSNVRKTVGNTIETPTLTPTLTPTPKIETQKPSVRINSTLGNSKQPYTKQTTPSPSPSQYNRGQSNIQQPVEIEYKRNPTNPTQKTNGVKFNSPLGGSKIPYVKSSQSHEKTRASVNSRSSYGDKQHSNNTVLSKPRVNTNFKASSGTIRTNIPLNSTIPRTNNVQTNNVYHYEAPTLIINEEEIEQARNFIKQNEKEEKNINETEVSNALSEREEENKQIQKQKPIENVNDYFEQLRENEINPESDFYKDKTPKINNINELINARDTMDNSITEKINKLKNLLKSVNIEHKSPLDVKKNYYCYALLGQSFKESNELASIFSIVGLSPPDLAYVNYKELYEEGRPKACIKHDNETDNIKISFLALDPLDIVLIKQHIDVLKEKYKSKILETLTNNTNYNNVFSSLVSEITLFIKGMLNNTNTILPHCNALENYVLNDEQQQKYETHYLESISIDKFKLNEFVNDNQNDSCTLIVDVIPVYRFGKGSNNECNNVDLFDQLINN